MKKINVTQEEIDIVKKFNEKHPEVVEIARLSGDDLTDEGQLIAAIERGKTTGKLEPKKCDKVVFPLLKMIADKDEEYFKEIFKDFYGNFLFGGAAVFRHEEIVFKLSKDLSISETLSLYIPVFLYMYEGLYSENINFLSWPLVYSKKWQPNSKKPVKDYDDFRDRIPLNSKIKVLEEYFKPIDKNHSFYLAEKWRLIRNSIAHLKFRYSETFIDLREYRETITPNVFENEVKTLLSVSDELGHSIVNFKTSFSEHTGGIVE